MSAFYINSSSNAIFKHLKKLSQKRSYRYETGQCLVVGEKAIDEALSANLTVIDIWLSSNNKGLFPKKNPKLMAAQLFNDLVESPQITAIAQCRLPELVQKIKPAWKKLFFLADMQDPNNVGAIIRSARAFGMDAVCVSKQCVDVFHPKVWRSSLGALAHLPILQETAEFWDQLKKQHFQIIALDASGSFSLPHFKGENVMAIFGQEGQGISLDYLNKCDQVVSIPIQQNADSINVAVAAGIVAYQFMQ